MESLVSPAKERQLTSLSPTSASAFKSLMASVAISISDSGGSGFSPKAKDAPITTRRFYTISIDIRNIGMQAFPTDSSFDVLICQRDWRGNSFTVPAGFLVGSHEGVACGDTPPGSVHSHSLQMRLASAGLFDIVVSVYDKEVSTRSLVLEAFLSDDGALSKKCGASPVGFRRDSVQQHELAGGKGGDRPQPLQGQRLGSPASSPRLDGNSQRSNAVTSLKRVGLVRRRRNDGERGGIQQSPGHSTMQELSPISASAVRPFVGENVADSVAGARTDAPIATGIRTVEAVNDTRWSSGLLGSMTSSGSEAGTGASGSMTSLAHLVRPDTIVRQLSCLEL